MTDPFTAPGRFWRGNLHTHSNRSDGVPEPAEDCRRYRDEGYDFIALTDHFVGLWDYPIADTTLFRSKEITTLLGAELHSGAQSNGAFWHILAVGPSLDLARPDVPNFTALPGQETGPEIAARAVAAGVFVANAHPQWSALTLSDARSIGAAHAVEVCSHGCHVGSDRGSGFAIANLLLGRGPAGHDDRHR